MKNSGQVQADVIVFTGPNQVAFDSFQLPLPGPGQVLTRTLFTGVSTGTETRVLAGDESGCDFPLIPGYENVGEIIAVGKRVDLAVGTRVFVRNSITPPGLGRCWGAHMSYTLTDFASLLPLPPKIDPIHGLYAKTGGIALHGVMRGRIREGEQVVVVGLGLIGHLAAQIAIALGAKVIGVDLDNTRLVAACKAGLVYGVNAAQEDPVKAVQDRFGGGADVAIDVTGVAATVDRTARLLRPRPWHPPVPTRTRLVILGSYQDPVVFSYHPSLFDLEPDILPSRDCTEEDMERVLAMIAAGRLKPGFIPAKEFAHQDAPDAYKTLQEKRLVRAIFRWA
jgi:2-desacetyl-2-hydroxyethyl bacteriochlorophyllide A dehydrogenase